MTHVITGGCCNDASCTDVCPVDCIHPTPAEAGFLGAEMLYIDPNRCIDCGMCVEACPVDAIAPDTDLTDATGPYLRLAEAIYAGPELAGATTPPAASPGGRAPGLRVAIVGSGAAGGYAAKALLAAGAEVDVFDRRLTPLGLIRSGIAPDHPHSKLVAGEFPFDVASLGCHLHLGVEAGTDVTHEELLAHHHAVLYAVGADQPRVLDVPGAGPETCRPASEFVAWYNGDPARTEHDFDLTAERVVVIGNGNVALDVARILVTDPDELARTDIADYALAALRSSAVREVVILGRRGPAEAAFTSPEMLSLMRRGDFEVVVSPGDLAADAAVAGEPEERSLAPTERLKATLAVEAAAAQPRSGARRIVMRYRVAPTGLSRSGSWTRVDFSRPAAAGTDGQPRDAPAEPSETIEAGIVLTALGYEYGDLDELPASQGLGRIPNVKGRVTDPASGEEIVGTYVAGWAKRGASGSVGSNRGCAAETVAQVIEDYTVGRLTAPRASREDLLALLRVRRPELLDKVDWSAIDRAEVEAGRRSGRPRVKLTSDAALRRAARDARAQAG